ncbi:Major facilitator superfamily domain, general substrate transporter [Penicillium italicum]|uniref:Major facilitator superfamily domain, general substrate transporter n=1 Tax=Penicillium italicum TaxID=40296 RepID=A0A0A2LAJ8_PENIT|nr:Major facilitator superfamily domain, general substrate transporter [Penicillium italicum]
MAILLRDTAFGRTLSLFTKPSGLNPHRATADTDIHPSKNDLVPEAVYLVDWTGPTDQDNPRNWPSWLKLLVLCNVLIVNLSFYTAPGIYSASMTPIQESLGASYEVAMLGLSLFVIAYGVGPLILSPISNLPAIGRTPVYVLGSLAFCLFSIGAALAKNIETVIILRVLGGLVGASPTCIGGTTIAEVFGPRELPYALAVYVLSGVCGPAFGPLLGTAVVDRWGSWSAALWLIAGIAAMSTVFMFFLLPETLADNILYRRAAHLRQVTGDNRYCSPSEAETTENNLFRAMLEQIAVDFRLSFIDPVILFINIHTMFIYGILYLWYEFFPYVFGEIYGFTGMEQSFAFFGIFVGAVISVSSYMLWIHYYFQPHVARKEANNEIVEPEEQILPGAVGAICIPICLFIFGWTSRENVHWILPIIGTAFFAPGFHLTFQTVLNYLGQSYPSHVAGVFAGNAFFRSAFGGALPLAARRMLQSLGIGWASSILGFISLGMIPPLFVLYRYGQKWRSSSKYASK